MSERVMLVFSNAPDSATARAIAERLVGDRVAACVNQLPPCVSTYHWQGKLLTDEEVPLLIKTTKSCLPAVQARIQALHPYELPELIAVPIDAGLPDYLAWVAQQCRPDNDEAQA